jgi:hypothetical protein
MNVVLQPNASPAVVGANAVGPHGTPTATGAVPSDAYHEQKLSIKLLSIDAQFKYQAIANDYGPFSLGQIVRFVRGLAGLLRQPGVDAVCI